jgi:CAAX prenyl protease-like protein
MKKELYSRIIPFILYMLFVGLQEGISYLADKGFVHIGEHALLYLYPAKIIVVILSLIFFGKSYPEFRLRDVNTLRHTAVSIGTGVIVFILWINMNLPFATFGTIRGYDPTSIEGPSMKIFIISFRLLGAAVVVPVMEEIFWRSFLIRYIVNPEFVEVPVGYFTWGSFFAVTILFGMEHNLWLAGMMAGAAYNLVLYHTKSITHCIIAHAVTNLALGVYVLFSGQWQFW